MRFCFFAAVGFSVKHLVFVGIGSFKSIKVFALLKVFVYKNSMCGLAFFLSAYMHHLRLPGSGCQSRQSLPGSAVCETGRECRVATVGTAVVSISSPLFRCSFLVSCDEECKFSGVGEK